MPFYTLNGFVFTLLGIYDWSTIDPEAAGESAATAGRFFDCGLASVLYTLPYYDVNGMSAYDLGHVLAERPANVQAEYHAIHIQLLNALYSIEPLPGLAEWRDAWMADVAPSPVP